MNFTTPVELPANLRMVYRTVLLLVFVAYIVRRDMPLGSIPVISWLIKK